MFKIGDKVKLVRHDQYPRLVGLGGEVIHVGIESSLSSDADKEEATEPVYRVRSGPRTLYDIPESWLRRT